MKTRTALLTALAAALAAAPGCVTTSEPKGGDDGPPQAEPAESRRGGSGAIAIPANLPYVPWKMVGGSLKGFGDGVGAGFGHDKMPLLGLAFSPVNGALGFLTGFFEGAAMSPALLGPSDDVGRAFGAPLSRKTNIWWYD